jgi:CBS-domain-containing membrane protein
MRVEETMTREVLVCAPADNLNRAAQLMWENDFGCVPVVEGDFKVVGMLTDRDICMAAYAQGANLHGMQVSSAMSREVFSCQPSDELIIAQQAMRSHHVRRLAVLGANGKLVGIISFSDIARAAQRDGAGKAKAEVADTLAAVSAGQLRGPIVTETRTSERAPAKDPRAGGTEAVAIQPSSRKGDR